MPVYSVQFAVTAAPIALRIHADDQAQAIQQAREWAQHVLQTGPNPTSLLPGAISLAETVLRPFW